VTVLDAPLPSVDRQVFAEFDIEPADLTHLQSVHEALTADIRDWIAAQWQAEVEALPWFEALRLAPDQVAALADKMSSFLGRLLTGDRVEELYGDVERMTLVALREGVRNTDIFQASTKLESVLTGVILQLFPSPDQQTVALVTLAKFLKSLLYVVMETYRREAADEIERRNRELASALEYQTATSDVLKVISGSSFDVQPVFETIVATAARLCGADSALITNREGDGHRVAATFAETPEFDAFIRGRLLAADRGTVVGRTALEGQVVQVADVASDPEYTATEALTLGKTRTVLGVPLLREGVVVGTIGLGRNRVQPFTNRQIELVRTFADQAVIALENARLLGELQQRTDELAARNSEFGERIEHQSATIDVLKVMSASPGDPQPVFDLIARRARELCNASGASLHEFDGELIHLRSLAGAATFGAPDAVEAYRRLFPMVPTRDSITCRAILDQEMIHVRDMATAPGVSAAVRNLGAKSQISLPLLRDGAAIGAMAMSSGEIGGFTDSQVELLKTFAEQAVIAITSAETYRELQQRTGDLQESLEYQTATSDVLKVISRSTFDIQPVFETIVATAARLCDANMAGILRPQGEVFRYAASYGYSREFVEFMETHPIRMGRGTIVGRTLIECRPVHIPDIDADPEYTFRDAQRAGSFRSMLGVPLLRVGTPIGVIVLMRSKVRPYTEEQIELVATFADQAVIAMENARLFGELQARTDELTRSVAELQALEEVLRAVNSSLDLDTVLATIISRAVQLSQADEGTIYEFDETEQVFVPKSAFGMSAERVAGLRERRVRMGETHLGRAAVLRAPVHVEDVQQDPTIPDVGELLERNRSRGHAARGVI
jgi:GAF domain-containing protein